MGSALQEKYRSQGFVVIPDLISDDERTSLAAACEHVISRTRMGLWPHRRTVGKQFPPYDANNLDSWGVQHVMHPDLGEPAFVKWYTSEAITSTSAELLGCSIDDLQMELFNLLINPEHHEFALRWHRDDVGEKATEEEELQALQKWHYGVRLTDSPTVVSALYRDSCLYLVPGSHKTPRTPAQRQHSETLAPPTNPLDMPGSIQLTLQPGETVFYNSNILHCATYNPKERRATLHATMGDHGLDWMQDKRFQQGLHGRSRAMLDRVLELHKKTDHVGYRWRIRRSNNL
ncbi:hypothetical protein BD779DRAFT_1612376 [Infundibulicybe gibba]|nr:hypothetical protein BD779DRAFT_1612376 [Infundibulicybe gibba]